MEKLLSPEDARWLMDNWHLIIIGSVIVGLVLGVVPFVLGRRRGMPTLGLAGLVVSGLLGGIGVLFSLLAAAAFSIVILLKSQSTVATHDDNLS